MRLLPALLLTAALALAGCGDDSSDGGADSSSGTSSSSGSSAGSTDRGTPSGTADPADVTCTYDKVPDEVASQVDVKEADLPPSKPTVGGDVKVTMKTSVGDFGLTLDATKAPCTVNSFVSLTEQGWYDGAFCQRLTTLDTGGIAVLQCGDLNGDGLSSPGYQYSDELDGSETYPAGTVAMANRGAGTDSNSAQFFLVYDETPLPPSYTVFGTLDDAGVKIIQELAAKGTKTAAGGFTAPAEEVKISAVDFG
jgi:peptidyl-prolyl cis-trans isomerase B (cyclophilin B)